MARVLYTRSAETDLLEAWLFIAEEDPVAADRVLDAIDVEANTLSSQPLMGRARPELGEGRSELAHVAAVRRVLCV